MIPERLLQFEIAGREAVPRFLTPADHHWLRVLIDETERFEGRRMDELRERLREPLPCYTPDGKFAVAVHVLERLCGKGSPPAAISPRRARAVLFAEAQRSRANEEAWDRAKVLDAVASALEISSEALDRSLFADLPRERLVELPSPRPAPHELTLRVNLALAQGFLQRASRVSLVVRGNVRPVVRQVRLCRLLCEVRPGPEGRGTSIGISGPYSLFRRTTLYGRALGSLVPVLRHCDYFELEADAVLRGRELSVRIRSGDPIFPAAEPGRHYDSKLEEKFSLAFRKLAPDFDVVREPEALRAGEHLVFPDFAIFHRRNPDRRVLLEIVGFWTPDYLKRKLDRLAAAGVPNLILCIDDSLNCADESLPDTFRVLRYVRRVDAEAVLRTVTKMLGAASE